MRRVSSSFQSIADQGLPYLLPRMGNIATCRERPPALLSCVPYMGVVTCLRRGLEGLERGASGVRTSKTGSAKSVPLGDLRCRLG